MRRLRWSAVVAAALLAAACSSGGGNSSSRTTTTTAPAYPRDDTIRLNQIQVLGSHNSYHLRPEPQLMNVYRSVARGLADSIDYSHVSIGRQLATEGVRQ